MSDRSAQFKKIRTAMHKILKDDVVTAEEENEIFSFYEKLSAIRSKDPAFYDQVMEVIEPIQSKYQSRLSAQKAKAADRRYDVALANFKKDGKLTVNEKEKLKELDARRDLINAQNKALKNGDVSKAEQKKIDEALARMEASDADLSKNLLQARRAVKYVLGKLKMKAANWQNGDLKTGPILQKYRGQTSVLYEHGLTYDEISIIVHKAEHFKAGNCDEMSLVSLRHLESQGAQPIDNMCLGDNDHCFNVIGRSNADPSDWRNWGDDAVVCDPWAAGFWGGDMKIGAYPASIFGSQMSRVMGFSRIRLRYRS